MNSLRKKILIIVIAFLTACQKNDVDSSIYSENLVSDTLTVVKLIPDFIYANNNHPALIQISEFTVDDNNRVYIAEGAQGHKTIHVFEQNGTYLGQISGEGRGPGEAVSIRYLHAFEDYVYFIDSELGRINIFSNEDLSLVSVLNLNLSDYSGFNDLPSIPFYWGFKRLNDTFNLISVYNPPTTEGNEDQRRVGYYLADSTFRPQEKIFDFPAISYTHTTWQSIKLVKTFPFNERVLLTHSNNGFIYVARNTNFSLKKYSLKGDFIDEFTFDYDPVLLDSENDNVGLDIMSDIGKSFLPKINLPKNWPIIHSMESDDKGRIWIATRTELPDTLQWFIMNSEGKLTHKFLFRGDRSAHPFSKNLKIIVKNGFLYSLERVNNGMEFKVIRYMIHGL